MFPSDKLNPSLPFGLQTKKGRKYQFWQRNSLCIELRSENVYNQKLDYIHNNPVKAGMCILAEDYKYSSARYYIINEKNWSFLADADD